MGWIAFLCIYVPVLSIFTAKMLIYSFFSLVPSKKHFRFLVVLLVCELSNFFTWKHFFIQKQKTFLYILSAFAVVFLMLFSTQFSHNQTMRKKIIRKKSVNWDCVGGSGLSILYGYFFYLIIVMIMVIIIIMTLMMMTFLYLTKLHCYRRWWGSVCAHTHTHTNWLLLWGCVLQRQQDLLPTCFSFFCWKKTVLLVGHFFIVFFILALLSVGN